MFLGTSDKNCNNQSSKLLSDGSVTEALPCKEEPEQFNEDKQKEKNITPLLSDESP